MGYAVQQRTGHIFIPEELRPFAEDQVAGDQQWGALVEFGDQVEKELPATFGEGEVSQLIQYHQIKAQQAFGEFATFAGELFLFQLIVPAPPSSPYFAHLK